MNDSDHLDWNENGLIFYSNVPKLQTLASFRLALIVWRNEIIDRSLTEELPSSSRMVEKFHAENRSSIPTSLRDLIVERIRRIRIRLKNWLRDPYDGLDRKPFTKNDDTWTKYFDQLVWSIDYTVDYLKTCRNLLLNDRLSDDEKFALACQYCLEKDIEILWIRVLPKVDEWGSLRPWLLRYWIDRMKNLTISEPVSNTFDQDDFILNMPLNRWAIDYFWPYLSVDARIEAVSSIISAKDSVCLKFLLPKLDESVLLRILGEIGPRLVETLIENAKCRSLAVPFWNHVKDIFDEHKFFELVRWMLISEVGGLYCHFLCEKEFSLCETIWISAPERSKEYVLNYLLVDNSVFMKARLPEGESYRSIRLLKMIISEAAPDQRNRMWKENWLTFCVNAKSSDINELLELCLENATEMSDFKRQIMMRLDNDDEARRYCFYLLDTMEFVKLDELLKICAIDSDAFVVLKQRLVRSYFFNTYSGCSNMYFRNIDKFSSFIDDCFENADRSKRVKKEIMMARFCFDRLYNVFLYDEDFATIKELVAIFLSDEQDVKEWKEEFEHHYRHFLSTGQFRQFDAAQWQDFLMWCLGTEQKVLEFKHTVNADDVFEVFAEANEGTRQTRKNHEIFDSFLKWRFNSEDCAAFKNRIASANPEFDDIRLLLFGKRRRNDSIDSTDSSDSDSGSEESR